LNKNSLYFNLNLLNFWLAKSLLLW
jgi:hypothetical protein